MSLVILKVLSLWFMKMFVLGKVGFLKLNWVL